jgi:hypothetical protein
MFNTILMELPKFNEERRLAEKGVVIVKDIIDNNLNWIFRKVPLDEDFGIDGYIDILHDGKFVTGKSIAVQIKTAESYFRNITNSGWLFYGENKHLNYYLNYPNPVIIIIVNPDTKECFWSHVTIEKLQKTERSWRIQINKSNTLKDKNKLSSIAGCFIDYAPQLEYIAAVNKEIKESGLLFIAVDKSEVVEKNFYGIHVLLKLLLASDEMIHKCQNKLVLTIFGYDSDPRELFEISEVRQWMKEAFSIFKYWGYFACMESSIRHYSTISTITLPQNQTTGLVKKYSLL